MTTTGPVTIDAFRLQTVLESVTAPLLIDVRTSAEFASVHIAGFNRGRGCDAQTIVGDLAGCPAERAKAG
jgi:rhodanese-related sulfurtransferase